MKLLAVVTLASLLGSVAFAQSSTESFRRPIRLAIRHADPWFVKAMIEGMPSRMPELSTVPGFAGGLGRAAGAAVGLLQDGILIVNPTDNSLWFYPRR